MRILLALLALTTLATACGDDEGGLSKADLIAQGDAICADFDESAGAVEPPEDESEFGAYLREVLALAEGTREDFAALEPPEDGEAVHEALLESLDGVMEALDGAATAAEDGDTVTAEDLLGEADTVGNAADEQAVAYGFEVCGSEKG